MALGRTATAMKRPAAAKAAAKPRAKLASRGRRVLRSGAIINALRSLKGLDRGTLTKLEAMVKKGRCTDCTPQQRETVQRLEEKLQEVEEALLANVRDAQSLVDGSEDDRRSRIEAHAAAQARLAELKQAMPDARHAVTAADRALEAADEAVESTKASRKGCAAHLKGLFAKRGHLTTAESKAYEPLKVSGAAGAKGQKTIKELCKTGKQFGFHDVLLTALPAVLRKLPDKRRTFDDLTIKQLENEFAKGAQKFDQEIAECEASAAEQSASLQAAEDALAIAKEQKKNSVRALEGLQEAVCQGKAAVVSAQSRLKSYRSDSRKAISDLKRARAQLISFRKGPLAAFGELQTEVLGEGSSVEAARSEGSGEGHATASAVPLSTASFSPAVAAAFALPVAD